MIVIEAIVEKLKQSPNTEGPVTLTDEERKALLAFLLNARPSLRERPRRRWVSWGRNEK